eukprot:TRINITY_DN35811_c0_g1_i1.p1 TRINITY_DN35811_c0_g1~~TRINITY_DN35811_c0_g1_i1.p1  ORF type:complete len:158 (-),score=24.06 TRINITY_DN35811_c0_g1_i1:8-442(-)
MVVHIVLFICIWEVAAAARRIQDDPRDNHTLSSSRPRRRTVESQAMVFSKLRRQKLGSNSGGDDVQDCARKHLSGEASMFASHRSRCVECKRAPSMTKQPMASLSCVVKGYSTLVVAALVTFAGMALLTMPTSKGIESAILLCI